MSDPLLKSKRLMRVSLETTKGTPVSGANYIVAFDPDFSPDAEFVESKGTTGFSGHMTAGTVTKIRGKASFTTRLRGNGSGGPDSGLAVLFQASGHKVTAGTVQPATSPGDQKTATLELIDDGVLKQIPGASGKMQIIMEDGKPVEIKWDFEGDWVAPTPITNPTPSLSTELAMTSSSGSFTMDSGAMVINKFELSSNGTFAWQNNHNIISDRDPQISFDPQQAKVADYDFYGKWATSVTAEIVCTATNGTDDVTVTVAKAQQKEVKPGEREGVLTYDITAQCNQTSGDDDYTIVFSSAA